MHKPLFLSLSFFYVIAPSLPEIKLIVAGGQAGGVDGGVGQVDDLVHGDDGEIVVQAGGIEPGVLHNGNSLVLLHTIAHTLLVLTTIICTVISIQNLKFKVKYT